MLTILCILFCLESFIKHNDSEIQPCYCLNDSPVHSFLLLSSIPSSDTTQFVQSLNDECLGCFQFLPFTNKTSMNESLCSFFSVKYLGVESLFFHYCTYISGHKLFVKHVQCTESLFILLTVSLE